MSAAPTANKRTLFWAITFILPLLVLLIPTNDVFTQQQKMFLAITAWTILMFAFELVDNYSMCYHAVPFHYDWRCALGIGLQWLVQIHSMAGYRYFPLGKCPST